MLDLDLDIDTHFFQRDTVFDGCLLVCGAFDDDGFAGEKSGYLFGAGFKHFGEMGFDRYDLEAINNLPVEDNRIGY